MSQQTQQIEPVGEDLDARVDALLREMEDTADRVARRMNEDDDRDRLATPEEAAAAQQRQAAATSISAPETQTAASEPEPADPADAAAVMEETATEVNAALDAVDEMDSLLAAAIEDEAEPPASEETAEAPAAPADSTPAAPGDSGTDEFADASDVLEGEAGAKATDPKNAVENLDELLAAAAADVMASEDDGEEVPSDAPVVDAQMVARDRAGEAAREATKEDLAPEVEVGIPAEAKAPAPEASEPPATEPGPATPIDEPVVVIEEDAKQSPAPAAPEPAAQPGPPNAPSATMAPSAPEPRDWKKRVLDLVVHAIAGAAASARPHAIRAAWGVERFTLALRPQMRATIKFLAVWTLLNAIAAWGFVLMRSAPKPPAVEEENPAVITGAAMVEAESSQ